MRKGFWDRQGGKHCKSLEESVRFKVSVKNFDFGKRMTLFCHYFIRNGVEQSRYVESVSFSLDNVIK